MTNTRDTTLSVNVPTGREPDLSPIIKTRFQQICQKYGIPKENILDLTKVGKFSYLCFLVLNSHVIKARHPKEDTPPGVPFVLT